MYKFGTHAIVGIVHSRPPQLLSCRRGRNAHAKRTVDVMMGAPVAEEAAHYRSVCT